MSSLGELFTNPAYTFLGLALGVGALASVAFGVMGTFVVTRRISYLAGSIAHCAFGGIGLGLYLRHAWGFTWAGPFSGALLVALGSALLIGWIGLRFQEREDTVIGALWAIGMAAGLLLLDLTPGYFNATSYLFGDILLISPEDFRTVLILDGVILAVVALWYRQLLAAAFDAEFALLRGIPVGFLHLLLLCLTALTVVLMVRIVGIILVVALLTLPAAVAAQYTRRFFPMMVLAVLLCLLFTSGGLFLSYHLNLSSGPVIILLAGTAYLLSLGIRKLHP
jgi:zinc transport system permease protein